MDVRSVTRNFGASRRQWVRAAMHKNVSDHGTVCGCLKRMHFRLTTLKQHLLHAKGEKRAALATFRSERCLLASFTSHAHDLRTHVLHLVSITQRYFYTLKHMACNPPSKFTPQSLISQQWFTQGLLAALSSTFVDRHNCDGWQSRDGMRMKGE